jgi:transcriptional regulator with XRE-family HTH domain
MSQEELGRRVGVQRAAIQKYEKGTVKNIPIETIEKMAKLFDVSPTYIVGWDDSNTNPLAVEVKVIQGVKRFYGDDGVELLEGFVSVSKTGKKRIQQYVSDMTRLYGEQEI